MLYLFDLGTERLHALDGSDPEYYGVSWNEQGLLLAHSGDDNAKEWQPTDFASAERFGRVRLHGVRDACSAREILHGHQVEWAEGRCVIANTGRNAISVWSPPGEQPGDPREGRLAHRFLVTSQWDGLAPGNVSLHLNSVHVQDGYCYAVAHNGRQFSAVWQLTFPGLELVSVFATRTRWAHNVWHTGPAAGLLVCDSKQGALYSVDHDEHVWRLGRGEILSRGLCAPADMIVIGLSEFSVRSERAVSGGGLALIDRASFRTLAVYWFEGIGNVQEVRALDEADDCHAAGPASPAAKARVEARLDAGGPGRAPEATRGFAPVTPLGAATAPVLEFGEGAGMTCTWPLPGVGVVRTERTGDSNLVLGGWPAERLAPGSLVACRIWITVREAEAATPASGCLRLCFLDGAGGYIAGAEVRSATCDLMPGAQAWPEIACIVPVGRGVAVARLLWLQSGPAVVELRGPSCSAGPLPGTLSGLAPLPTAF